MIKSAIKWIALGVEWLAVGFCVLVLVALIMVPMLAFFVGDLIR